MLDSVVYSNTLENDDEMDLIHINIERVNDTDKYIAMFSYKDVRWNVKSLVDIFYKDIEVMRLQVY